MKKILIFFQVLLVAVIFAGCEKEGEMAKLSSNPISPEISAPTTGTSLVMTKPLTAEEITFDWSAADYGVPLGIKYTLQMDKEGNGFASPVDVASVNALSITMTYGDFNSKMVALEAEMDLVNPMVLRVKTSVPNTPLEFMYSDSIQMNITPYTAKDFIYLVGAFNGWNAGGAVAMNRNLPGLKHELYVNFTAGNTEYKILPTQGTWDGDIGDDGANPGKLISDGEQNMWVPAAGIYRVNVDLAAMTWSTLATTWGIIGGFPGNDWASDYATMTYGAGVLTATITTSAAAIFKFRANTGWDLNLGDSGADGTLEPGGDNISLTSSGTYTITLNLNPTGIPQAYTYTVTKL